MKNEKIIVFFLIIFLLANIPLLIADSNQEYNNEDEQTTILEIDLIRPFGSKSVSVTIPLKTAQELFHQIKEFQNTPENKDRFIEILYEEILKNQEITKEELSSILCLPQIKNNNYISTNNILSSSDSLPFASITSVGSGRILPLILLPRPRLFFSWHGNSESITNAGSLTGNRGIIAIGEQNGFCIGFAGIGLTYATAYYGGLYGFIGYSLFTTVNAEYMERLPLNNKPVISNPSPAQNQENVELTLSELTFHINDEDNDLMSYQVITSPNIGQGQGTLKRAGTYRVPVSNLEMSTDYTWTVTVDDGEDSTTSIFSFSTIKAEPVVRNPNPADKSSASSSISELSCELYDAQNDFMDYTIETSPNIGSASGTHFSNGRVSIFVNGLNENTLYHWFVNVTDGTHWTREKFSFYTGGLGLVGYWNFDEGTGSTAYDFSGNNNDGKINGASWTTGIKRNALSFDGNNDYISVPNSASLNFHDTNRFSISLWVKRNDNPETSKSLISNGHKTPPNGYQLTISANNQISINIGDGNNRYNCVSNQKITDFNWHHLVAVWDGEYLSIYINGLLDNSTYVGTKLITDDSKNLEICNHYSNFFNGILDEIRIYERVLDYNEIKNLYENP